MNTMSETKMVLNANDARELVRKYRDIVNSSVARKKRIENALEKILDCVETQARVFRNDFVWICVRDFKLLQGEGSSKTNPETVFLDVSDSLDVESLMRVLRDRGFGCALFASSMSRSMGFQEIRVSWEGEIKRGDATSSSRVFIADDARAILKEAREKYGNNLRSVVANKVGKALAKISEMASAGFESTEFTLDEETYYTGLAYHDVKNGVMRDLQERKFMVKDTPEGFEISW